MRLASTNGVLLGLATAALVAGCPASPGALCDQGACDNTDGAAGDGTADATNDGTTSDGSSDAIAQDGSDGGSSDGPSDALIDSSDGFDGFTCPTTAVPKDQACVIDESLGVFVSPTGNDTTGAGTKALPYATIAKAMTIAKGASKRVYTCAGTYAAPLAVDTAVDGVKVYGGLKCSDWSYTGDKAIVAPTASGFALTVSGLTSGVTFEDFEFDAKNAANTGDSSTAAFVKSSQGVVFTRTAFKAGDALTGGAGNAFSNHDVGAAPSGTNATSASVGGSPGQVSCLDGTTSSHGGVGGSSTAVAGDGTAVPSVGSPNGGLTGMSTCTPGTAGANGTVGAGGAGATSNGSLTSSGWIPAGTATDGANGNPGQGGGGGGGRTALIGGGGGGSGGCGGGKGLAAQTGGSSIALAVYQSSVTITSSTLVAGNAGNGGKGGDGQPAQPGGTNGIGACDGAPGGNGGGGGGAGGGAGGLSVGILWTGTAPTIDGQVVSQATTQNGVTIGTAGLKGAKGNGGLAAGNGGAGQDGTDGKPGDAKAVIQAQ